MIWVAGVDIVCTQLLQKNKTPKLICSFTFVAVYVNVVTLVLLQLPMLCYGSHDRQLLQPSITCPLPMEELWQRNAIIYCSLVRFLCVFIACYKYMLSNYITIHQLIDESDWLCQDLYRHGHTYYSHTHASAPIPSFVRG